MADQLSLRGGTTTEHATFTGANKEVTVDTTKKTLVVNDGATVGGHPLMRENASNSALALGSAGTPSLKFTGDTNTGIYSPGADQLAVATNGAGRLFINSNGSITAPQGTLTLGASGAANAIINSADGIFLNIDSDNTTTSEVFIIGKDRTGVSGGSELFRITEAGLVGIGNSAPGHRLSLADSISTVYSPTGLPSSIVGVANTDTTVGAASLQIFTVAGAGGTSVIYHGAVGGGGSATGQYVIGRRTGTSTYAESLRISATGNVGINTASPGTKLEVNSGSVDVAIVTTSTDSGSYIGFQDDSTTSNTTVRVGAEANDLALWAGNTERARIDSSGRLLVGTSTAYTVGSAAGSVQIAAAGPSSFSVSRYSGNAFPPVLSLGKSRGTSLGAYTATTTGDQLGLVEFAGSDGTDLLTIGASIFAVVDGAVASNSLPTSLAFTTTTAASPTERMRIDSSGRLLVGTSSAR
jgi:hypothetical protein